jgi:pyruvate,orthophosphate dikinase
MTVLPLDGTVEAGKDVLGGKAFSLVQMLRLGINVPPAFCITTDECQRYHSGGGKVPQDVLDALPEAMKHLQDITGRVFGATSGGLLVSVRSGAPTSMPGMMDTVLNLGITSGGDYLPDVPGRFREMYEKVVGGEPPHDPWDQLHAAIAAVFGSWKSKRAIAYRKNRGLPEEGGTAVTVQAMVFGNADPQKSGTGVLFTRNPLTGSPEPFGEWLAGGQGEDVVSGSHDPEPLSALEASFPDLHAELMESAAKLERDGRDMQDIEFTVESGRLWLLQARAGKRSPAAAIKLAVLLEKEGVITSAEALDRVTPDQAKAVLRDHVDPAARADATVLATGKAACPGLVKGTIVTDVDEAEDRASDGEDIILARPVTTPDDMHAMAVVSGIVTEVGGATSHAAVVSRELGVACVVGVGRDVLTPLEGQTVTLDADAGELLEGDVATVKATEQDDPDLAQLSEWARAEDGADPDLSLPQLLAGRTS